MVAFVLLVPAVLLLVGMVFDVGVYFESRLHAKRIAASAARAGTNDIDEEELYDGRLVLVDDANEVAIGFVDAAASFDDVQATSGTERVTVDIEGHINTTFLSLIGIERLEYAVSETAVARYDSVTPPIQDQGDE